MLQSCVGLELAAGAGVTVTENRPTLEPVAAVGSDVALVRVDTMKRPMVVG